MKCAAVAVLGAFFSLAQAQGMPQVGQRAPALKVRELGGKSFDLAALRGKVVIVNFWATWCSPCRAEMPVLNAFYERHHAQGVELLGLSIDDLDDQGTVRQVMRHFRYPVGLMKLAKENGFGAPMAVPITYIIDSKGVIRQRLLPGRTPITAQVLKQAVLPLLAKR